MMYYISCRIMSYYVMPSYVVLYCVVSCRVVACRVAKNDCNALPQLPQYIDTVISLLYYANAFTPLAFVWLPDHSHICACVILSISYSFLFHKIIPILYLIFRCGVFPSFHSFYLICFLFFPIGYQLLGQHVFLPGRIF